MSSTAFTVGAELVLADKATPEMRRLIEITTRLDELMIQVQGRFDKLGFGPAVGKIKGQWEEINRITQGGVESVVKSMSGMGAEGSKAFASMVKGASGAFDEILTSSVTMQGNVLAEMEALSKGSVEALSGIGRAAPGIFDPLVSAARASAGEVEGIMAGVSRAVEGASARMSAGSAVAAIEGHATLRGRTMGAHAANNAHAGGMHFGRMGAHIGGAHASMGGDGIVPAVAGGVMLEVLKKGIEEQWDFDHWASGFAGAGFSGADIDKAKRAAWANAGRSPNASAIDGMKNILELNKATGSLDESIDLLPLFSRAEMAMQSVKAEGLHSKFTGGTQILNLAKGLEEMGYTTKGDTPEERQANVEKATNELIRTMVASRGLFDGNKLFAMTNNSGGAAQNWDLRFGTTIAPIIGDIMNHSKLGNADYMSLKSFQGGHITSDAVSALVKYHLAKTGEGGDAYQDTKGNWHLKANSEFAKGMDSNLFDWSGGVLDKLKASGYDINDQKFMNGVVNEIGSNKSNSMLMRAVLEPGTRKQIQKEIDLRDKVPNDVAGVLQYSDPVLKLDAMHKKLEDFYTALGEGVAGPAIAGLTKLTAGINALSQAMEAHPEITKYTAGAAGVAGLGLFGYGAGKMLGVFGGADAGLNRAATNLDAAAEHLMLVGGGSGVPGAPGTKKPGLGGPLGLLGGVMTMLGLAEGAQADHVLEMPKSLTGRALLNALEPNLGGLVLGKEGGASSGLHPDDDRATRARASDADAWKQQQDMMRAASQQFGALKDRTGFVLTSFEGLNTKSGGLNGTFGVLEATALGAARALATVAMSGAGGGGSGLINASWGGGSPDLSAAFRGGGGAGIGHVFSASERESNIRKYAASIGINPDVAMAVARSEGFGRFDGDRGTSFGDLQMHIGGGLGDTFRRATGLNPADPKNELALDRFALDQAKRGGWAPWHGAARIGVHGRYGMDYHAPTVAGAPPTSRTVAPGKPAAAQHAITAVNTPQHIHVYVGDEKVAHHVAGRMVAAMEHPNAVGGPDTYGSWQGSGSTPLNDAA